MLIIFFMGLIIYWLALSLFAFYNVRKIFKFYSIQPQIPIKDKWKAILRSDFGKWDEKAILKGCFTRFPYHVTVLGFYLVSFAVLIPLSKLFGKKGRTFCIEFQRIWGNFATRQAYKIIQPIKYLNYRIQTPIVIANHVNWFDVWFIGITFLPISIVSKAIIKKTPILGTIGDFFQTIYVERESSDRRNSIVEQINDRVNQYMDQQKIMKMTESYEHESILPLIIFPQGTTSNGRSIMTFKTGAFRALSPITLFTLKYYSKQFEMGMGDISQAHHALISLCLRPTLEVNHRIVHALDKQTVEEYCERCRDIMCQMTGYEKVECGFRDSMEYQNAMIQERAKFNIA